ncbi:long-chain-fatty-acid--CoA ligase [Streptomyces sp. NPDC056390]|uniref:long-chain-fatty-acid--CoA ligase n=1 Tax=Streptomyces sp. NPDC056390 TaxID=3345806 RepID=UPI0035DD31BF
MTTYPHTFAGMTISDQLARHARMTPGTVALTFDGTRRSYGELDDRVSRLAQAMAERGVGEGDRVAVLAHNGLEIVETYLACARAGAICVPLNFRLVADEIAYQLADSGAVFAVVDAPLARTFADARSRAGTSTTCLVVGRTDDTDTEPFENTEPYEDALRAASPDHVPSAADLSAPAFIMYTSRTTGRPKGAVLTHYNVLIQTVSKALHVGMRTDCRTWLIPTPMFHIAGLASMATSMFVGGHTVLARSAAFDASATVDLLQRERVNCCFFVPAQWQAICDLPDIGERDLSALRLISWGAAPASTTLLRRMVELFGHADITTTFGQTETCAVTTILQSEDALRKIGSVGTPLLNTEVRVVDAKGADVPPGEVGEIVYRGPSVMTEYWNKPADTAAAFAGGWFHSGDLVRQDEDGYLYGVDRLKDMIISGGENIYCVEVEDVLAAHPQVAEVAVVGVPDEKWGETPMAVVVPADPAEPPTGEDITRWCRERLAPYKCPRRVSIVDTLPRNPSGKVRKNELRDGARSLSMGGHLV